MKKYSGIDLHSNNSVVVITDETDRVLVEKRMPNELTGILALLEAHRDDLIGVVVESTYNWYWLVDGLQASGFKVHLANTTAIKSYDGLKHSNDETDAAYLAHLLRLGILRTAHIYPKDQRATRDLARKRMQLVRSRTQHVLAVENIVARETAVSIKSNDVTRTHFAHGQAFRHRDVGFLAHPGRSWWTFPINDMISHALTLASPEIRLSALVLAHHDIDSQRHQQCDHEVAGVVPVCDYDIALFEVVRKSPHECCLAA
jgi:hypothetical protein